ncbi:MAG: hypothetical protein Q8M88_09790 [Phenylobacterium sp.]|uniref:hypothetical protein n=1 Tax=Phenylobacterium sp. TaxID=1871053 RepID=UPI002734FC98|nr:hypothetical protein [Phenylobacterium sp.]MDP3174711.1 hypothetical protein [Phenylobacterium sp.]
MANEDVFFYVNGPARLLMSCVIADELFPNHRKHLILLDQFGYRYEGLLPHLADRFERVIRLPLPAERYSHADQFIGTYFNRFPQLRSFLRPDSTVILFGIRSPAQKFMVSYAKRLNCRVEIYAESLAVDRYFTARPSETVVTALGRRLFRRAFDYQHDYDVFYVPDPDVYQDSPWRSKLAKMFDLYGAPSFRRYAELLTREVDLTGLDLYDTVLLGQPLSNYETFLTPSQEEAMLQTMIGERAVLVLPHPNERLDPGRDKYRVLPNAKVLKGEIPSELLLLALYPKETITFYSTASVNYAMMNKSSVNLFYPIHKTKFDMLCRFQRSLPNMVVSSDFLISHDPYAASGT